MSKRTTMLLATALMLSGSAGVTALNRSYAQDGDTRGPNVASEILLDKCMVAYIRRVDIPAAAQGAITEILVEEGQSVTKDSLIARIDDSQAKLAVELAKPKEEEAIINATNDVNLRDSQEGAKIAKAEAESYKKLYEEKAVPYWEMKRNVMESDRSHLRIELAELEGLKAKQQYFGARAELRMAEDELTRRQIKAPFDGFIERREAQLGQWVQPGSPIVTLVQMDMLKVEGQVNALRYSSSVSRGAPVSARVLVYATENNDEPLEIEAALDYVSTEIDMNGRYRVWVKIPNQAVGGDWLIKPGMRAKIIIKTGDSAPPKQLF